MSANIINITEQNFQETIKSGITMVDFWAPWCGPCRVQGAILDKIREKINGKARVVKVDVDNERELAGSYEVQSIPTLIVFKDGRPVKRMVGVHSESQLIDVIENSM